MTSITTNTQTQPEPMDVDESPFAPVSINGLWTAEYADAINKLTASPEEPNTLYRDISSIERGSIKIL